MADDSWRGGWRQAWHLTALEPMQFDRKTYHLTDAGSAGKACLWIGILGLALSAVGLAFAWERTLQSYLVAFAFWLSLGLGALFFTMLHHLTGAVWSVVLRRLSESLMANLPLMMVFFVPVALGMGSLYHWSHHDTVAADVILQKKAPFLNVGFFLLRSAAYFLIWFLLARGLYKTSLAQDGRFEAAQVKRFKKISAPGMILFAFTCTFASIDWLMALDPHWYSTIFGVYFFAGSISAVMPLIILIAVFLRRRGVLANEITVEHYQDLGKLTFAFMILWSYMAFSQYFLIWYGNIPEETIWFHRRWNSAWKPVSLFLPFAHFVVPFFVLMSRAAKRNLKVLTFISFWLLVMHWVDLSWLVLPNFEHHHFIYSWTDLTCVAGLGGIFMWLFWKRLGRHAIVPVNDPRLQESIRFVNI